MNKKFLSAILFGALMVTSTGTFVSCKDYDDDIKDLQTQINSNKDAIAALQKLVGEGNWVTGITSIADGFTVTMSNGQTTTITAIKGADGKDGVEWTIGEDGFWYKDGEKTDHQAVAEDGKPGVTAPSPSISADGKWVVYEWDATKEEFVATTTEIPAQGTSAYVVKKDGVYVLHIADETGAFQDVTLPATSDSFVAEAPASLVEVQFAQAKWNPSTSKSDVEMFDKIKTAFPEVANYKKNDLLTQGGNLPVLITPANVELTNNFSFSLQNLKGEFSDAVISNPVKGLPAEISGNGYYITTRAAEANDCFWTLSVEPEQAKNGQYTSTPSGEYYSLAIENEKGTVVKTGFSYKIIVVQSQNVTISTDASSIEYADVIDILTVTDANNKKVFTINNGLNGHYVLEATNALQVEKYGLKIEGSKLEIGNMPSDQPFIDIDLELTALGLNGSVTSATQTIRVSKAIEATGNLADKTVTLSSEDNYVQTVEWNIADLGLSAVQLDQFLKSKKSIKITWVDADGNEQEKEVVVTAYDKNNDETTDYKEALTFGFELDSQDYLPGDYSIRLEANYSDAVVYAADATLTLVNPTSSVIKLAEALVENNVLQITGTPKADGTVTYNLVNGLVFKAADVQIIEFEDLDAKYDEESWVESNGDLTVDKYSYTDKTKQNLYKVRNFKVTYQLFNNAENTEEFEFQAQVVSEIYSSDATKVIVMDEDLLSAVFGGANKTNQISLKSAITKAIYAAGVNRGKTYNLFKTSANATTEYTYDYSTPMTLTVDDKKYVVNGKNFVALPTNTDALLFDETLSLADIIAGKAGYITDEMWGNIWTIAKNYYHADGTTIKVDEDGNEVLPEDEADTECEDKEVAEADKAAVAVFNEYKSKIDFASTEEEVPGKDTPRESNLVSVTAKFVDATTAAKYATVSNAETGITITAKSNLDEDIPSGKVELQMQLEIVDAWGMKMVRDFNVTLTTN